MCYDPAIGKIVEFGGEVGSSGTFSSFQNTTWTFNGTTWSQLQLSNSPQGRMGAVMVYDPIDNYVVMFGGQIWGGDNWINETWIFNGTWTQIQTSTAPSERSMEGFTWNWQDGYAILFGGLTRGSAHGFLHDTWSFVHGTWTKLSTSNTPTSRAGEVLAYSNNSNSVVMFGGITYKTSFAVVNDTWAYSAGTWTQLQVRGPPVRHGAASAYDDAINALVVYGGGKNYPSMSGAMRDTWTFNGTWHLLVETHSPGPLSNKPMAYDPLLMEIILPSGQNVNRMPVPVTWALS